VKNGVRALDALTLTIREGEHTAILGPNGAGKTALINLLTHDDYPMAGTGADRPVRVFGRDRWEVCELRKRLGVVSADLHDRFVKGHSAGRITGVEAVLSGFFATQGFLRHVTIAVGMREQALEALARVDAGHLAGRFLDEMSTGEARRVLIARALVTRPRALVLDEPTAGLDLVARHAFLGSISRLARAGTTLVLVTHHVEEIVPEVARIVFLRRGRVTREGAKAAMLTPGRLAELFEAPVAVTRRNGWYFARPTGYR
jgi:iron complex transport system ATP-binding protein